MKIWCVDHAGLSWNIHSDLYFTKAEAQEAYDKYDIDGFYRKMYQVEDIWGWCGKHFDQVVLEVLSSRDDGDDSIYIYGLVDELKEAAAHCKLEQFSVDAFWLNRYEFLLSLAWVCNGELHHSTRRFEARDDRYDHPTIVERKDHYVH